MRRPQAGHGRVRQTSRMRAARLRSTIPPLFRRRALPSPQAAVDRESTRSGAGVQGWGGDDEPPACPCGRRSTGRRPSPPRRRPPILLRRLSAPHRMLWRPVSVRVWRLFDRDGVMLGVRPGQIPGMEPGDGGGGPGGGRLPRPATGARDPPARPALIHARPRAGSHPSSEPIRLRAELGAGLQSPAGGEGWLGRPARLPSTDIEGLRRSPAASSRSRPASRPCRCRSAPACPGCGPPRSASTGTGSRCP